jgi:twitching motility protein PilT
MSVMQQSASAWTGRLLEALVSSRSISEEAARRVLSCVKEQGMHVAEALASEGVAQVSTAMEWLSALSGLAIADLDARPPDPEAMALVPVGLARFHRILGYRLKGRRLSLACAEPPDAETIRIIAGAIDAEVGDCVLADPQAIARQIANMSKEPALQAVGDLPGFGAQPKGGQHLAVVEGGEVIPPEARGDWTALRSERPRRAADLPDPELNELLALAVAQGASDLHLTDRFPPAIRVDGSIRPVRSMARLQGDQIRRMIFGILPNHLRERFEETKELDTAYAIPGLGRFRLNVFQQRGAVGAVFRTIPDDIPELASLGLPPAVGRLANLSKGLVLVTGPTGSGKSTTLASLIRLINEERPLHIVTIEEPIEFLHGHGRSIVNQREVGQDTLSFAESLRHVLRQDPDVIMVGELRDLETISMAITAAETGHLVFATLHTQDAPQSIDRMIDVFPTAQQEQVRMQLAGALEAIVTQQLVLAAAGEGRVCVAEIMLCTPGIRNLIRSAKTHQVYSLMQTGGDLGMQTMDQALAQAVAQGRISEQRAMEASRDPSQLLDYLRSQSRARSGAQ